MVNPGQLRRRIEIKQLVEGTDDHGFSTNNWQTFIKLWASVKTVTTRIDAYDFFSSGKEQSKNTDIFTVRYTPGITSKMRVIYNSRTFEIFSVAIDDELNKTMTITAREVN